MLNYENIKNRAINIKSDINASRRSLKNTKEDLEIEKEELEDLRESRETQAEAIELLKELIDEMSKEHIYQIEDMLTFGLQTIFYDEDYSVKIRVEEKNNYSSADMYLLKREEDTVIETKFNGGIGNARVGGGVRVVVGFMLQTFYIKYFDLNRIIFMDEAFSELSEKYVPGLIKLINKLSERDRFNFVLISHDTRINPYANRIYRVEKGDVTLEKGDDNDKEEE